MDYCEPFKGKRITLMGLGVLGRGVGDAEFLSTCGAEVLVTDKKTAEELSDSIVRLKTYPNITFHLGGHDEKDFTGCDMVIKAAGVPLDSPYIASAKAVGIPVYMSTALFAKFAMEEGATVVGVTGTRGKSTVAHMIFHVLQKAGRRVHLGGNIRGKSTLATLPEVAEGDVCVLELDSWQLQGLGELKISPGIAVFTNFMPDHLNYYGGDMEKYFADKANIFRNQKAGDTLVAGKVISGRIQPALSYMIVPDPIPTEWKLKIIGEHNRENASLATAALRALELSESEIKSGLGSFGGVEGRLQFLREIRGVKIYNDNNATTPEATIAALKALDEGKKNIILILGGDEKNLDMEDLIKEIPKRCSKVVLFKERGTERIRDAVFAFEPGVRVYEEEGLENTVKKAFSVAGPGETILYSPAFSSFGKYFKNEFDRNDQFLTLVRELNTV